MAGLLVSVRSLEEAKAAFESGAALIDVKEPAHGSLGHANSGVIEEIVAYLAGRRPVSAAMGELQPDHCGTDWQSVPHVAGLRFLKWGLANCRGGATWRQELLHRRNICQKENAGSDVVAVAYADWRRSRSPTPEEVCRFACDHACGAFLIDTWCKDGRALLDWLSVNEIDNLVSQCRQAGVRAALAGSLRLPEITLLQPIDPDWFAVRGAVCRRGERDQAIDEDRIRSLVQVLGKRSRGPRAKVQGAHAQ